VGELVDVLMHPSRWQSVGELSPRVRTELALVVLGLTVVAGGVAGLLTQRWARKKAAGAAAAAAAVADRIARVRRALVLLVYAVGAYLVVEVAPLSGRLETVLSGAAYVVGALVVARLIIHVVTLLLTTSVAHVPGEDRARFEREYVPLAHKITTLAIGLVWVVVVAKHFGQDVTSLVAALGVGSLAIGLAAQQTLGNMIAGFVLLVDRPFRPGDRVKLASGESGEVLEIGVRSTRILMNDRNLLIVPNTELANSRVVNFAGPSSVVHADVKLTVAHGADIERATVALLAIAAEEERIRKDPAPLVRVSAVTPLGLELSLGFDVGTHADVPAVEDRVRRRALARFTTDQIPLARHPDGARA
jgi:MscS family membrane protein